MNLGFKLNLHRPPKRDYKLLKAINKHCRRAKRASLERAFADKTIVNTSEQFEALRTSVEELWEV